MFERAIGLSTQLCSSTQYPATKKSIDPSVMTMFAYAYLIFIYRFHIISALPGGTYLLNDDQRSYK
jgi:hypothetical protein